MSRIFVAAARAVAGLALAALPALAQDEKAAPIPPEQLQPAIDAAIDRGVAFLVARQNRDGSWGAEHALVEKEHDLRHGQTALALYTLLECGLPAQHAAIVRGLVYLEQDLPARTYALGAELLFYGALRDDSRIERMRKLTAALIALRIGKNGLWTYGEMPGKVADLSNTLYAVLGLRAAQQAGVRIPRDLWSQVAEAVLTHQEPSTSGRHSADEAAGFGYQLPIVTAAGNDYHSANASMTCAGIALLAMCIEAMGANPPGTLVKKVEDSTAAALAWLDKHYFVEGNAGGATAWHYSYLCGLERVGALLSTETIGAHKWYPDSAQQLIKEQAPGGEWSTSPDQDWPPQPLTNANTCFALQCLAKATATPTRDVAPRPPAVFAAEDPASPVWLRAVGGARMELSISGFGQSAIDAHAVPDAAGGEGRGLRVTEVQYWIDGELAHTVAGDATKAWVDERFAAPHEFTRRGEHRVQAKVLVAPAVATPESPAITLESAVLAVNAPDVLEPWMLEFARAARVNLLAGAETKASSSLSKSTEPRCAIDGMQFTAWVCKADDAAPSLTLECDPPVRGFGLLLSQANANQSDVARYARITHVEVRLNSDAKPLRVELDPDILRKSAVDFAHATVIRRIEIRILARAEGALGNAAGFAEVELVLKR